MEPEKCAKILWILWACVYVGGSFRLQDCYKDRIRLIGNRTANHFEITCEGLTPADKISWSIEVPLPGTTRSQAIADCEQCHEISCPCEVQMENASASRNRGVATVRIPRYTPNINDARIKCKAGIRGTAFCTMKTYSIRGCSNGTVEVDLSTDKQRQAEIYCDGLEFTDGITWYITDSWRSDEVASCPHGGTCLNRFTDIQVEKQPHHSTMIIGDAQRLADKIVQCRSDDDTMEASCKIRVVPTAGTLSLVANTCPDFIPEGTTLNCKCSHMFERRSPRPKVDWENIPGQQDVLEIKNVTRNRNGAVFTCRSSESTDESSLTYTLNVAYGPDRVTVTRSYEDSEMNSVVFTCTAYDVNPGTSIDWSIPCVYSTETSTSRTCAVHVKYINGASAISCTASNYIHSHFYKTAVYTKAATTTTGTATTTSPEPTTTSPEPTTTSPGPTTTSPDWTGTPGLGGPPGSKPSPNVYLIGAAVAAIVVTGIVLVIVIVVVRRKQQAAKQDDPTNDDEFVEFINDIYESSDGPAARGAARTNPSVNPPQATAAAEAATSAPDSEGHVYDVVEKQKPAATESNRLAKQS